MKSEPLFSLQGSFCISSNLVCDGVSHCQYGEDEFNDVCPTTTTQPTTRQPSVHLRPIIDQPSAREVSFLPFFPAGKTTPIPDASVRDLPVQETSSPSPGRLTLPPNAPDAVHLSPLTDKPNAREISFLPFFPEGTPTPPGSGSTSTASRSLPSDETAATTEAATATSTQQHHQG